MNDQNSIKNMVMVDGYIVPLDSLTKEYQEMVKKARAKGEDIEFHTK